MAEDERTGSGGAERESRFVNLLHPNRDMATNWSVDVGKQLEGYLDELKATGLFDDGNSPLNFAEAALLIQGSIQVYSRKVEYLYNLVVRALDYLEQKKQGQEGGKRSAQESEEGGDSIDESDEVFLNLDDAVHEEEDIDLLDEEGVNCITQPVKIPPCLLMTEGESFDQSGEAGELTSYLVATCTMYRDFLLLDPSDMATVDEYLASEENLNREREEGSGSPSSSEVRGSGAHDPMEFSATPAEDNVKTPGGMGTGGAEWQGDGDEGMMWDDPSGQEDDYAAMNDEVPAEDQVPSKEVPASSNQVPSKETPTSSNPGAPEKDHYIDPWVPLNPHEEGNLPVNPFKKGSTQRTRKIRKDRSSEDFVTKRYGLFFPEFAKALQTKQRQENTRRRGEEASNVENARNSSCRDSDLGQSVERPQDPLYHEGLGAEFGDSDNEYGGCDDFEAGEHDGGNEDLPPPASTAEEGYVPCQDEMPSTPRQDPPDVVFGTDDENMSLEDLCRAHVDSILEKLAESQVRCGLNTRVTTWKNKIEAKLKYDDSLPPFDIHDYGDRLLARLSTSEATSRHQDGSEGADESFANLINGQPKYEVARSFSALLQLVNNGNVMIDRSSVGSGSYCFSAENSFQVKLIDSQNPHNEMFQHMIQHVPKANRRKKIPQQTDISSSSERLRSPIVVSHGRSPVVCRTPRSGLRVGGATPIFMSPISVRKRSRKRGQSTAGKIGGVLDLENITIGTPEKNYTPVKLTPNRRQSTPENGYTPVKLTPNRRQSKRKPLQTIQA